MNKPRWTAIVERLVQHHWVAWWRAAARPTATSALLALVALSALAWGAESQVDFNRDIRPILSNNCYKCHGPDATERKGGNGGLRLDTPTGAFQDLGGYAAIVPGKPEKSELIRRIRSTDAGERMPPPETGKTLTESEIALLEKWIALGAPYAEHWSYRPVVRPPLPPVRQQQWPRNAVDFFVLARLEQEGMQPSPEAEPEALIRRVTLDLTGLPPTPEEVETFLADRAPDAYERMVDRLLDSPAFGEHFARLWLDLARYADSAGYADDPPRTIWAYRDYVIRALNRNSPFDQFTIEQIAGDLLPNPTDEQLIATAMHRNTLTNNEGGTNDEEFRNVAVVDRVNTTFAVWMGTTINCAQCHNHKYDPISQKEFFQVFAIFNNTADADRRDESPLLEVWSEEQKAERARLLDEQKAIRKRLTVVDDALRLEEQRWEESLRAANRWTVLAPSHVRSDASAPVSIQDDHSVRVATTADQDSTETVFVAEQPFQFHAIRLEALPDTSLPQNGPGFADGNFVLSGIELFVDQGDTSFPAGRFVRIDLPGENRILSLAEVQVFSGSQNVAVHGVASQSSTDFGGEARRAIDGNTDGRYEEAKSTTHTAASRDPWWEVDLKQTFPIERIAVWNRTDGDLYRRLDGFRLTILDEKRQVVWQESVAEAPRVQAEYHVGGPRRVALKSAHADVEAEGFPAQAALENQVAKGGWAIGRAIGQTHHLVVVPAQPTEVPQGAQLRLRLHYRSSQPRATLGRWRCSWTDDPLTTQAATLPASLSAILAKPRSDRTLQEQQLVDAHFLSTTPLLNSARARLEELEKQLASMKPLTTVPIMKELPEGQRRETRIQRRGNFLDLAEPVEAGVPAVFAFRQFDRPPNRLDLAQWLVDPRNPLTARVMANRFWEQMFGAGLVRTSEEFGTQGDLPSHPELLDWLSAELVDCGWDIKYFLRLLVTSSTYRQSSKVTSELMQRDPDNRLLARGPRFRLSAEMIRDQALAVSGLLSRKMYGEPVRPVQPKLGVNAAFGSGIDWQPSSGEDQYRRAIYTTWRRSNPYPSMVTFDAPNREVCTIRRDRTNTPLQALVTLNDPVYVEAAQALARRMMEEALAPEDRVVAGFRWCLARKPSPRELARLLGLYQSAKQRLAGAPEQARLLAGRPGGQPMVAGDDSVEAAAWTVVANVLLNLDEFLMKR